MKQAVQIILKRHYGSSEMTVGRSKHRNDGALWISFDADATEEKNASYLSRENVLDLIDALKAVIGDAGAAGEGSP